MSTATRPMIKAQMRALSTIYKPLGLERFELCHPVSQKDFEKISVEINGVPRIGSWSPIPVRLIHEDEGISLVESDSPWLGAHALVFRHRAVEAMGALLANNGELLALSCSDANLSIFNATKVLDALDEQASRVVRFKAGQIMMVQQFVFRPEAVRDAAIFKIPNLRVSPTFVGQPFVDRWNGAGLKGLEFMRVWGESPSQ